MSISLGMLVPNSRDQHEKWQPNFTHHKHALNYDLFEKNQLKCTSNTINNIVVILTM